MTGRAWLARAVGAVGVLAFSAAYLVWDLALVARVPDLADWLAAAEVVRADYRKGDCVVFDPPWAQEGAPFLAGMDVVTSETVDWYEVGKRGRVWILTAMGRDDPEVPAGYVPDGSWRPGSVGVHRFVVPDQGQVTYDFLARIRDARVTRLDRSVSPAGPRTDRREECRNFRDGRWYCGAEHPWQFVGRHERDIAGAVREVLWAHPLNGDRPIEIRYPSVEMARTLVIHYGWTQRAVEAGLGAPVTFWVMVGDRPVFERVLRHEETGWYEQRVDVSDLRGRREDVVFTVSTPDYQNRQFCFTADMWEGSRIPD